MGFAVYSHRTMMKVDEVRNSNNKDNPRQMEKNWWLDNKPQ